MEKKQYVYSISFHEMLADIFENDVWYQGENFADGVFIEYDKKKDEIVIKHFSDDFIGDRYIGQLYLSKGIVNQRYRKVYTQPSIMRKV